jgi:hypothetical protein
MNEETQAAIPQDQDEAESAPAPQGEAKEKTPGQEERADEQPEAKEPEQLAPKTDQPKGVQKRLDELRRQAGDAQRMNERLLALVEQSLLKGAPPKVETPSGPPKREDFESYEAYLEARADWKVAESVKGLERSVAEERARQAVQEREQSWRQKEAKTAERYEDYEEVTKSEELSITPVMAEAIKDSDMGPEVAYYLGKNPQDALRISQLSPAAQVRELGKIEARLELKPAVKQASKAPPPVDPVGGGKGAAANLESVSQAEYEAARKKQGAWWANR